MTSKVLYTGNLRTEATHLRSGSVIETDAPTDNRGKGERFSPTDLVATALAACIVTTMGIAGDTHDINIDGTECEVEKIMASDPRRIGEIKVNIIMPAGKTYSEKERLILERAAVTCPVAKSLHPDLKETISFVWG
ncbi:MAG: OsmC family protein [Flavipsychrobacter sp.]|nr:OsmC family protein [Flavipsychrobacter sp.]